MVEGLKLGRRNLRQKLNVWFFVLDIMELNWRCDTVYELNESHATSRMAKKGKRSEG